MRLNLESDLVGSSTALVVVTGVIDWSTIAQFRAGLSRLVSGPRPDVLVDFTGLLSWSQEAQQVLATASGEARLHGGRLEMSGLAPIPAWQAGDCDLPGLERVLEHATPSGG
jgi:anti-anti-sigma regulatory factor